jgi:hypothetical protein
MNPQLHLDHLIYSETQLIYEHVDGLAGCINPFRGCCK